MDFLERSIDDIFDNGITWEDARDVMHCSEDVFFTHIVPLTKTLREKAFGKQISFCSIVNAKSGSCSEACDFCSQSAHFKGAQAPSYPMYSAEKILSEAMAAEANGATEFSIVTSGRGMNKKDDLDTLVDAIGQIRKNTQVESCASLGLMEKADLQRLREAGMTNYHHNIETARSYFPNVVHTHSFDDEMNSIKHAKELGFQVCCGGIVGMGESKEQRIEFAFNLKEIDPHSIPLNFLNPRPGTPMAHLNDLTPLDSLKMIAIMRLVLPKKELFVCGGREVNLKDYQDRMFDAGASGTMLGNYLTTSGRPVEDDRDMITRLGLEVVPPHQRAL
jgi:biotin synthase